MKKILFSPIGGTDPISNCRDGAMLHICRVYKPDIVYLYLSKEMMEFHKKDNRYRYCLEKLGEQLNHHFQIECIEREDLEQVQIFDAFIEEYQDILKYIIKKYPDSEYYLNVSSGTPAMKSSLQMLSILSDVKMTAVQVSTPVRKINPHLEDREDYDPQLYWECNDDNDNFKNRCEESKGHNMLDEIKKQIMIKHIEAYDYVAALAIADSLVQSLPDKVYSYLRAANWRLQLNIYGIQEELKEEKANILPIRNEKYRNIFEHILNLQVKLKKEEYIDFVRGLTPVIVDLFQLALKEYSEITYTDYVTKDRRGLEKWDDRKIQKNIKLKQIMDRKFGGNFHGGPIYSSNLLPIIEEYTNNSKIVEWSRDIRKIEEAVRNLPAHEIVSVTKEWIIKRSGYDPEEILHKIKDYAMELKMGIRKEDWNSYDDMNMKLIDMIKRG